MPFRPTIILYRAQRRTWPLWAQTNDADQVVGILKARDAPDPPTDTMLSSYDNSVTYTERPFTGVSANLNGCAETVRDALIWNPQGNPRPLAQQRFATPAITTGLNFDRFASGFACSELLFIRHTEGPGGRQAQLVDDNVVTWRLADELPGRPIRGESEQREVLDHDFTPAQIQQLTRIGAWPRVSRAIFQRLVTSLGPGWEIIPATTQPRTTAPVPIPKPAARAAPDRRCFDPTTGEELDCESGEPKDREKCQEEFIRIPDLEDILHLKPRQKLPWREVVDPVTGKSRWTLDGPLTTDQAEEFIRRREIAHAIRNSPQPEFVQSIGQIMTAIDNIQDALLTAIVFARLGIKFLPKSFYRTLLGALGIADAMQLLATGGLGLTRLRAVKTRLLSESAALPFTRRWRIDAAGRLARVVPTLGELVQVLQTTDWIFGIGLALGSIIGFILDLLFGLPKGAKIGFRDPCLDPVRANAIKQLEKMGLIPHGQLPPILKFPDPTPGLTNLLDRLGQGRPINELTATALVRANPRRPAAPFTQAEYLHQMVAYSVFLDLATATSVDEKLELLFGRAASRTMTPTPDRSRTMDVLTTIADVAGRGQAELPLQGNPTSIVAEAALPELVRRSRDGLNAMIALDPISVPALYIRRVADQIAWQTLRFLDPDRRFPSWEPAGDVRVLHTLLDRGLRPPAGATAQEIAAALAGVATLPTTREKPVAAFEEAKELLLQRGWELP